MKIVMALVAALATTPTWADCAADEEIRRAQVCSNDKAVRYSRETAKSPQTIAEAAFDACERAVERLIGRAAGWARYSFHSRTDQGKPISAFGIR